MHKALLLLLAVGGGSGTFAQAPPPIASQRDSSAELSNAQKRTELRKVLSAGRRAEATDQGEPAGRQLSEQERAEMREQLRRYQPPVAPRAQQP